MAGVGEIVVGLRHGTYGRCEECIFWRHRQAEYQAAFKVLLDLGDADEATRKRAIERAHGFCHAHAPVIASHDGYRAQPMTTSGYGCGDFQHWRSYHASCREPVAMMQDSEQASG